jgi:rubredoxin
MAKHNCGVCGFESADEKGYLEHTCKTGFKPTQIEHQDALTKGAFSKISARAQQRGAERTAPKAKGKK